MEEEEEEETFNWVFVALMSDGTLRQYANEVHGHGHAWAWPMHAHELPQCLPSFS